MFAFPKREPREPDPPGVIPAWLPVQLKALSWVATVGVFYMLWAYSLSAAKDAAAALEITKAGTWNGHLVFWFPLVIGYLAICIVVAWTAKIVIPAFVSLPWKGSAWPKAWLGVLAAGVSLVVIASSISVQTETRFESNRDAAVKVEQVGASRAAIEAQKKAAEDDLARMQNSSIGYLATAASVGAAQWQAEYIDKLATNDPNADRIKRALGAAKAADAKREEIKRLTIELAQAPTTASVAKRVTVGEADNAMASFVDWLGSIRSILLAILQDIACLLLPWIAMRTQQAREKQLAALAPQVATVDESHMIPHFTTNVVPQPYEEAVAELVTEDGEERVFRRGHYAKKAKRGKAKEADKPVPHSDTDPRVVRPLEAGNERAESDNRGRSDSFGIGDRGDHAPGLRDETAADGGVGAVPGAQASEPEQVDGMGGRAGADTTDLIAPPLSQEQAQALVDSGTHEYVTDDNGDRWLREIEREAQQGAADEIGLGEDGKGGVMKPERADG